jgi:hypothetical protein
VYRHYYFQGSLSDCKAKCESSHGSNCYGVEYNAKKAECRTFTRSFTDNPYENCDWFVSYAPEHENPPSPPAGDAWSGQRCREAEWNVGDPDVHRIYHFSGSLNDCKAKCISVHGIQCYGVEYNAKSECRTFTRVFTDHAYSNCDWYVSYAPSLVTWNDKGACREATWNTQPNRHFASMTIKDCKAECVSSYGVHCHGIEWKSHECRTFGGYFTDHSYSNCAWHVSYMNDP